MVRIAIVARWLLALGLVTAPAWVAEAAPESTQLCKKKKKAKKAKKEKAPAAAAKPVKIDSKVIRKWEQQGLSDDEILAKAQEAGYTPTPLGLKRMKAAKVRPSLIAALSGEPAAKIEATPVAAAPKAPKFDLDKVVDPNEINFDEVPPPKGVPERHKAGATASAPVASAAAPKAPMVIKDEANEAPRAPARPSLLAQPTENKGPRRPVVAN